LSFQRDAARAAMLVALFAQLVDRDVSALRAASSSW
jgi:hypothetical protein